MIEADFLSPCQDTIVCSNAGFKNGRDKFGVSPSFILTPSDFLTRALGISMPS